MVAWHRCAKGRNADTLAKDFTKELWDTYHALAEKADKRDAPEQRALNCVAALCKKYLPAGLRAVDLGCGMNTLRQMRPELKWTSVDLHPVDETVVVANMASLPFDDRQFEAAILSRSLWARDHEKQLAETFRVLAHGAPLIVCEAMSRWPNGTLIKDLEAAGFRIKEEVEGPIFSYIVVQKPALI